jgi:hypothetical protein
MRYLALSPRDNTMKVDGLVNVFCGGEKAGLLVGHTEAIITGSLAGRNAGRAAQGKSVDAISTSLASGFGIAYVRENMKTEAGLRKKYTFSGSVLFNKMKEENLYLTNPEEIQHRVISAGMDSFFARSV